MVLANSRWLYRFLRRTSLCLSTLFIVGVPLWHLRSSGGSGVTGQRWLRLCEWLSIPTWPPPLMGAPWTFSFYGMEILDPLAGLGVIVARGATPQIFLGMAPAVVLVALLGRFFCGWICPYALIRAASYSTRDLLSKVGLRPKNISLPKRLGLVSLGVVLAVTAITQLQLAPLVYPPAIIGREVLRTIFFGGFGAGALVIIAAFLFDTFISRAGFCRYWCPGGALFSLIGYVSPLRVRRHQKQCTQCQACERVCNLLHSPGPGQTRMGCERCGRCIDVCSPRALQFSLRFAGESADPRPAELPSNLERRAVLGALPVAAGLAFWGKKSFATPKLPPPRAAPGQLFASRCIRCMRCVEVCPVQSIRFQSSLDLIQAETPYLQVREQPCILCMKCTQACPTQALLPTEANLVEIQKLVRIGTPVHHKGSCIAWTGQGLCRLCYYACPFRDSAIILTGPHQVPVFRPQYCVGCGQCAHACPERAQAIQIIPLA